MVLGYSFVSVSIAMVYKYGSTKPDICLRLYVCMFL